MNEIVFLSLGSNLGDRAGYLKKATAKLAESMGLKLLAESSIYRSVPLDCPEGCPEFLNKLIKLECALKPVQLLDVAERLEISLGRRRKGFFVNRVIDIDIILFGDRIFKNERLEIPHPRMKQRAFVLIPLKEIEPDIIDPIDHRPLANLIENLGEQSVVPFEEATGA
ncbi:MAG: 2-amino-4-hydroxy-6-hydroxymethyldihydropteridine diphosphokinase [candidate division Zixibacteria bacterium]